MLLTAANPLPANRDAGGVADSSWCRRTTHAACATPAPGVAFQP